MLSFWSSFARVINNTNINYRDGKFSYLEHVFWTWELFLIFIKYIYYYHFHWHKPKVKSQRSKKKLKKTENINIQRALSHTNFLQMSRMKSKVAMLTGNSLIYALICLICQMLLDNNNNNPHFYIWKFYILNKNFFSI